MNYNFFTRTTTCKVITPDGQIIGSIEESEEGVYDLKDAMGMLRGSVDITPGDWEIREETYIGHNVWAKQGPPLFRVWVDEVRHAARIKKTGQDNPVTYWAMEGKIYREDTLIALTECDNAKGFNPALLGVALCGLIKGDYYG